MFSFMAINHKAIFIRIFRVLHTVQFSRFFVVVVSATACLLYHSCSFLSTTFFKSFLNFSGCHERRRFEVLVPVSQGQGISYHPFRQKSTPFFRIFSNCFNCIYNLQKVGEYMGKMHRKNRLRQMEAALSMYAKTHFIFYTGSQNTGTSVQNPHIPSDSLLFLTWTPDATARPRSDVFHARLPQWSHDRRHLTRQSEQIPVLLLRLPDGDNCWSP